MNKKLKTCSIKPKQRIVEKKIVILDCFVVSWSCHWAKLWDDQPPVTTIDDFLTMARGTLLCFHPWFWLDGKENKRAALSSLIKIVGSFFQYLYTCMRSPFSHPLSTRITKVIFSVHSFIFPLLLSSSFLLLLFAHWYLRSFKEPRSRAQWVR